MNEKSQSKAPRDAIEAATDAGTVATSAMAQGADTLVEAGRDVSQRGAEALHDGAERMRAESERIADRSFAALSASSDYGRRLTNGYQAVAEEWVACSRAVAERTLDRIAAVRQARNPIDLIGAQRNLITGSVEDMLMTQQRVADVSIGVMAEAAQRVTSTSTPLAA